jgi:hypothetical protein
MKLPPLPLAPATPKSPVVRITKCRSQPFSTSRSPACFETP